MLTYKQVAELQAQGKEYLIPASILEDDYLSMEYTYYYITKRWYQDYVDTPLDIIPDEKNKKFILYLNQNTYKQMNYNSYSFPSEYNGFPLEYRKKKIA